MSIRSVAMTRSSSPWRGPAPFENGHDLAALTQVRQRDRRHTRHLAKPEPLEEPFAARVVGIVVRRDRLEVERPEGMVDDGPDGLARETRAFVRTVDRV